jgi:hypothetical protein
MKRVWLSVAVLLGVSILSAVHAQPLQNMTVPAGTPIHVRTIDPIDVKSAQVGLKFQGSLADPLRTSGGMVIPVGTPVQLSVAGVNKAGRIEGRDKIFTKVDSITFNGMTYPVSSTMAEAKGRKHGRRTLKGAGIGGGAGALIGGIAGGGAGLAIGSLVGAGTGTAVSAATAKNSLTIPSESILSFQLSSPLRLK